LYAPPPCGKSAIVFPCALQNGPAVTVGASGVGFTVNKAESLFTGEQLPLVRTARYKLPFIETVTPVNVNVGSVAPPRFAHEPLGTKTCHCIVGSGEPPEDSTVNVAVSPTHFV